MRGGGNARGPAAGKEAGIKPLLPERPPLPPVGWCHSITCCRSCETRPSRPPYGSTWRKLPRRMCIPALP